MAFPAIASNQSEKTLEELREQLFKEEKLRLELQQNYNGNGRKKDRNLMLTDEDFEPLLEDSSNGNFSEERNTNAVIFAIKNKETTGTYDKGRDIEFTGGNKSQTGNETKSEDNAEDGVKLDGSEGKDKEKDEEDEKKPKFMKKKKKKKKAAPEETENATEVQEWTKVEEIPETKIAKENIEEDSKPIAEGEATVEAGVKKKVKKKKKKKKVAMEETKNIAEIVKIEETAESAAVTVDRNKISEMPGTAANIENNVVENDEKTGTEIKPGILTNAEVETSSSETEKASGYRTGILGKLKIKTKAEKLREKKEKEEQIEREKLEKDEAEMKTAEKTKDENIVADGKLNTDAKPENVPSRNLFRRNSIDSEAAKILIPEIDSKETKIAENKEQTPITTPENISRRNSVDIKILGSELEKIPDKNKQPEDSKSDSASLDSKKEAEETVATKEAAQKELESAGVLEKIYSNVTDTGISEEFLYSQEYTNLIDKSNKIELKKSNANSEKDIPVLYSIDRGIVSFRNSDIPEELLSYRRTEENIHIPTIFKNEDIRDMAKKAILQNDLSALRGIIEDTRDPDFFVDEDKTLLAFSVENSNYILTRYLIYSGASINEPNSDMNIPIHTAANIGDIDIVKLLIENGANINAQNILGETPLMLAIVKNRESVIYMLLKNGADINIKNNSGETAYTLCMKHNRKKIQQYLVNVFRVEATRK
ncbi:MAG: ankyrin repeat domain-containing protein [Rickettsiales bacterium]|nr:ankyrin repeat domain-containing protein [Rickettsiales bacterium]